VAPDRDIEVRGTGWEHVMGREALLSDPHGTCGGQLGAFLEELKAQGDKHVQEPAVTILREEAEALLNPSPPMPKSKKPKAETTAKPAR